MSNNAGIPFLPWGQAFLCNLFDIHTKNLTQQKEFRVNPACSKTFDFALKPTIGHSLQLCIHYFYHSSSTVWVISIFANAYTKKVGTPISNFGTHP